MFILIFLYFYQIFKRNILLFYCEILNSDFYLHKIRIEVSLLQYYWYNIILISYT